VRVNLQQRLRFAKRRIDGRLAGPREDQGRPMLSAEPIRVELADKVQAIACGGIGLIHQLAHAVGLPQAIDRRLRVLKMHRPYHESDHVLNLAYNALCGGQRLEDLELRRNDEAFLDALGAERIPDPTTAGDFCRRFAAGDLRDLMAAIDDARRNVWRRQPKEFFAQATIEMDGTLVATRGECKEGMDISYKGEWGYHPLLVSLAETGEVLRLVNRAGNRPSHEGAAAEADAAIALCRQAGFRRIVLRGDNDFSQCAHLDGWDAEDVTFYFGFPAMANLREIAEDLPADAWRDVLREPRYEAQTEPRSRPPNVKQRIVRQRGYENLRLQGEQFAEFEYRPTACEQPYRMIALRKQIAHEQGQQRLFDEVRYFFYITNDWELDAEDVIFSANDRCNQENLIAQLAGGVRALSAPVDNLLSNWAYMLMTSLAWNLKAWWALSLPEDGRWRQSHRAEKQRVLRMEFRTFQNALVNLPCQIVRRGRRLIYRVLSYGRFLPIFFRLARVLRC
jgi:hypothetical protein